MKRWPENNWSEKATQRNLFCSLIKGITPKTHMLCFVLINSGILTFFFLTCLDQWNLWLRTKQPPPLSLPSLQSPTPYKTSIRAWPSSKALLSWYRDDISSISPLALLSLQKLWSADTVLWHCPSQWMQWLSSLPIWMQKSFWRWQHSFRYIYIYFAFR